MKERNGKFPSTVTVDNFSSTTRLAENEVKIPVGSKETLNEYNPFDHRQIDHPNSTLGSLAHLLKCSLGTGILAMPNAFKNGGLLFGLVGTLVIGILCTHCVHILVQASREICKRSKTPSLGFSETAKVIFEYGPEKLRKFAPVAKISVDVALVVTYYMNVSVYVVFISGSVKQLVDYYCPDLGWSNIVHMALLLPLIIIICQIRVLKYLVPFSTIANVFLIATFAITLYYLFDGSFTFEGKNMVASVDRMPLFLSTVVFAMEGVGVVMPVENSMKHPNHFLGCPGVLNTAMSTVIILYTAIGFLGYLKYGEETEGSITYNLPTNEVLAQVVKGLVGLAIFFTCSLQFYVAYDITWKIVGPRVPEKLHNLSQIILRTLLVCMAAGIAMLVPDLEPIIGLVGSICFSLLGIFIPAFLDTIVWWEDNVGTFKWKLWKNIVIMVFSIFTLIAGSYQSINEILSELAQAVKGLVALAIFFTSSLTFYVAYDITWKIVGPRVPEKLHNLSQIILRTLLVCMAVGIAMLVPDLEPIIGLVGSVCFSLLGIFIPAFLDTIVWWEDNLGNVKWKLWKNIVIMVFSIFALIAGSYQSINEILSK